jgi:hypothetical protein
MPRQSADAIALLPMDAEPPRLSPSSDLTEAERQIFTDIVLSVRPSHFMPCDRPLLAAYARAIALERLASGELARAGYVEENGKPSPWLAILQQASKSMLALSIRLRLSPQGRRPAITVERRAKQVSYYDEQALLEAGRETA